MCRHQYPEQFVDRVGCVINALSESRSQSCCPTDSRGEQAPWSLPASSRASKAFGFRLADSSLNLANTTVKWKKPLPKTAASPQHTCLFMHNSQVSIVPTVSFRLPHDSTVIPGSKPPLACRTEPRQTVTPPTAPVSSNITVRYTASEGAPMCRRSPTDTQPM
jgi:hypothetical protein